MSPIRYSAATGGFYDIRIHAAIPDDAVAVSERTHTKLMRAQENGAQIVALGAQPSILVPPAASIDQLRARALAAIDVAAATRILAIASLARQSNDNAALAVAAIAGVLSDEASGALDRRVAIDGVRTRAWEIAATIAALDETGLKAFDAASAFDGAAA
ncbi:MAG: hypothetical protein K2Y20_13805 [Sphingomonas sp.]|nr:hypothetical protein [Sphingomonas sp.]